MIDERVAKMIDERAPQSPFFFYRGSKIQQTLDGLSALSADASIYYAVKANPYVPLIRAVGAHPSITGYEIASVGEAKEVLKSGETDLRRVIYTNPAKTVDDLKFVIGHNISCINLESMLEAHRISNIASSHGKVQDVLVRVNTNLEVHDAQVELTSPNEPSAFGIDEDQAIEAIARIAKLPGINLRGIHTYAATGILKPHVLVESVKYALNLSKLIEEKTRLSFDKLDVGGGFGVDYEGDSVFDVGAYHSLFRELIGTHNSANREIVLELGRHIVAEAGYFVATIVDIKKSRGMKVMTLDAGTNAHRRPYTLKKEYPIQIIPQHVPDVYDGQPAVHNEEVCIRGPLCTSADKVVIKPRYINDARVGDLLVMSKAGAYGYSMSHKGFLSNDKITEMFIQEE